MSIRIKLNPELLCESLLHNKYILEEYHLINNSFSDSAKKIISVIDSIEITNDEDNSYVYSGWCYDNTNNKCIESNKETYHPIYIRRINDINDQNIFSIKDRKENSDNDPIYLTRNISKTGNLFGLIHEFKHMIDMFITDRNTISNEIIITDLDDIINDKVILENAKYYKYLLLKSEQTAFINSTIFFLKDVKENHKDIFESFINEQEIFKVIKNMIVYSKEYNKIDDYEEMITNIVVKNELENYFLSCILYYMIFNKQKIIHKNDFMNFKNFDKNKAKEISEKILEYIRINKQEYIKNLYDMIYVHILSDIYK